MRGERARSGLVSLRTNASHGNRSSIHKMSRRSTTSGNQNKSRLRSRRIQLQRASRTAFRHRCCMKRIRFGKIDSCDMAIGLDSCRKFRLPAAFSKERSLAKLLLLEFSLYTDAPKHHNGRGFWPTAPPNTIMGTAFGRSVLLALGSRPNSAGRTVLFLRSPGLQAIRTFSRVSAPIKADD